MGWIKNLFKPPASSTISGIGNYPSVLTALPLKDAVLMPEAVLPLLVSNASSIASMKNFYTRNQPILAVAMKKPREMHLATWDNLYHIGCMAKITKISEVEGQGLSIMIKGIRKVRLDEKVSEQPFLRARVTYLTEELELNKQIYAITHSVRDILDKMARLSYHNLDT
ncbi:MAG: LON peptidase substrate-binding domain-containing protein, partial [Deltaproteobacteria bacterium]|nr:LON peptidase substrate-binding domain-containing protein [Deltaproteobacteria bacterium]